MSSTPPVAPSHVVHPLTPASGSALPVIGITTSSAPFAASNAPSNQLEESTLLYHKTVPVRVQSMQRDTTSAELSISIVLRMVHSHQKSQALLFQITDENDPFFLQQLEVTESDFQTLKREQALHVDFSVFPQNVLELLNLCCARPDDAPVKHAAELTLGANKLSTLQIFELHHFKNLQHLSLQFREGNDAAVKKYLADRLIDSKSRMRNLEAELSAQCANGIEQGRELSSAKDEMWKLREQHAVAVGDLKSEHANEVAALRQAVVDAQQSAVVRVDEMRKLTEKESRNTIESLQARCEELNNAWRTEGDARAQANTARTQLQMELDRVSSELSAVKTELVALRDRTRHHETAAFELQSAKQKHQLYEQQLKDKDELIAKISALHESGNRQSHSLDQAIAVHKANFEKADAELKDACREINKGNDIIQTLQSELKQAKSKLKMKSTVIQQQEQIILQKQQQLEEAQRAVARAQDDCAEWLRKHHTLESTLADARRDLEESAHKLSSNEQVIAFLNKEITESKLTGTSLTASALGSSLSVGSSALAFRPTIPVSSPTAFSTSSVAGRYRFDEPSFKPTTSVSPTPLTTTTTATLTSSLLSGGSKLEPADPVVSRLMAQASISATGGAPVQSAYFGRKDIVSGSETSMPDLSYATRR